MTTLELTKGRTTVIVASVPVNDEYHLMISKLHLTPVVGNTKRQYWKVFPMIGTIVCTM